MAEPVRHGADGRSARRKLRTAAPGPAARPPEPDPGRRAAGEDGMRLGADPGRSPGPARPDAGRTPAARTSRFLLGTAAILLAGALAAGLAARAVVAPRAGILTEQETPAIPTVLGQTAEEVRFPPWQLYDALPLERFEEADGIWLNEDAMLLYYFRQLGAALDAGDAGPMQRAMEFTTQASSRDAGQDPNGLFLCDYPAALPGGEPVLLQFASMRGRNYSVLGSSFSFLLEPAGPQPQSEQRQAEALERVKRDLKSYLMQGLPVDFAPLLGQMFGANYWEVDDAGTERMEELLLAPVNRLDWFEIPLIDPFELDNALYNLVNYIAVGRDLAGAIAPDGDPARLDLETFIEAQNDYGTYTIQLVTTPRQIVILLSFGGAVTGIYYDIQLERYSGLGIYWT